MDVGVCGELGNGKLQQKKKRNVNMHGNRWKYHDSQNIYKTAHICGDSKENEEKMKVEGFFGEVW